MAKKLKRVLFFLISLSLVISLFGCPQQKTVSYPEKPWPIFELRLDKAPRVNEPVKLICTRCINIYNLLHRMANPPYTTCETTHEKIELTCARMDLKTRTWDWNIPVNSILVGDSLNWEADIYVIESMNRVLTSPPAALGVDYLDLGSAGLEGVPLVFSTIVKFPKEGNWGISARSEDNSLTGGSIIVHVEENSGSLEIPMDYRPGGSILQHPPDRTATTIDWDIPKPPRIYEPVMLTWNIISMRDIESASAEIEFTLLRGTTGTKIPAEEMLIHGDLQWAGSLKEGVPVELSARIMFPEVGDWAIQPRAHVKYEYSTNTFPLYLHIGWFKSSWGWTESHERKYEGPPPPLPAPDS